MWKTGDYIVGYLASQSKKDAQRGPQWPGRITASNPDGTFNVQYKDGDVDPSVPGCDMELSSGDIWHTGNTPDQMPKLKKARVQNPIAKMPEFN